jgi:hypothetical protein
MTSTNSTAHPPRVAAWLVDLFSSDLQREAIQGDLLEEFSEVALRSGFPSARRWYWKQSLKTAFKLGMAGFRTAPGLIVALAAGGLLIQILGFRLWVSIIAALLDNTRQSVIPFYTWHEVKTHLFWYRNAMLAGQILVPLLAACMVAAVAKGMEMICAITLASLRAAMVLVSVFAALSIHDARLPWSMPVSVCAQFMLILMGGVIVREARLSRSKIRSSALRPS